MGVNLTRHMGRGLKWAAAIVLGSAMLVAGFIALFGWNWLRAPVERFALEKTGRVLALQGDLTLAFAWPLPRFHAAGVTFANPDWATQRQMVSARSVEVTLDLMQLLNQRIVFPQVRLENPVIFLERGTQGRKSWLLDLNQQDENARVQIGLLTLDQGTLGYDDPASKTSIRSDLSTTTTTATAALPMASSSTGVTYSATGLFKGQALKASGTGGPVLALRDESVPYPLTLNATVGRTTLNAQGSVTSLLKLTAIDMQLAVKGDSLEQLFPLLGIAAPATRAYATQGHLVHTPGTWRYEKFSGRVGKSDIAGTMQVDVGGKRPVLVADLTSRVLDIEDLGPLIGARAGSVKTAQQVAPVAAANMASVHTPSAARVLPDVPFKTDRWGSLDADVKLSAKAIRRAADLPLEDLVTRLTLKDSVMTLDPLNFGLAGGQLDAVVSLDGRNHPIAASAQVRAKKVQLAKLLPTFKLNQASLGQINGEFDLSGKGDTVRQMLATSSGKLGLVIANGEISKLMMEMVGLHLWEILELKINGDRPVKLRCAVADFDVKVGVMEAQAIVFDTEVTTVLGSGTIDLREERLDLTLNPKTKNTSPLALRSPIYVRGMFAKPQVSVNKGQVAARALGAIALGVVNPLLALVPLVDPGPGQDSDCRQLVRDARAVPRSGGDESRPRK